MGRAAVRWRDLEASGVGERSWRDAQFVSAHRQAGACVTWCRCAGTQADPSPAGTPGAETEGPRRRAGLLGGEM